MEITQQSKRIEKRDYLTNKYGENVFNNLDKLDQYDRMIFEDLETVDDTTFN